jgi:hypothetical protein
MYHATAAERREFEAGPVPELMPQFGRRQVASVVGAANVAAVSPPTALSWPRDDRLLHRGPVDGRRGGPGAPTGAVVPPSAPPGLGGDHRRRDHAGRRVGRSLRNPPPAGSAVRDAVQA